MSKWLTGIFENCHLFVGPRQIVRGIAKNGKSRIFFDAAAGIPDESKWVYATWRHCIAYGEQADNLKNIAKGSYIEVSGFIQTVAMRDNSGEIVEHDDMVVKEEHLICVKTRHIPKEEYQNNRQMPLESVSENPVDRGPVLAVPDKPE